MGLEYYVRGEDAVEYGPVSLPELAGWVRENRVGRGTRIRVGQDGASQLWEERPELVALVSALQAQALFPDQPQITLAPLYLRALAYGIDLMLVALPLGIAMTYFMQQIPGALEADPLQFWRQVMNQPAGSPLALVIEFTGVGAQFIYFTYFHGRYGITPGKRWLGIRVVSEQGGVPGYNAALVRTFGGVASGMFLYLGHSLALFSPNSRALHDFLARTYVVRGGGRPGGAGL
jgi:uncharacterized RDD family membrane protein YckC